MVALLSWLPICLSNPLADYREHGGKMHFLRLEVSLRAGVKVVKAMHQVHLITEVFMIVKTKEESPGCVNAIVCSIHNLSRLSIFCK